MKYFDVLSRFIFDQEEIEEAAAYMSELDAELEAEEAAQTESRNAEAHKAFCAAVYTVSTGEFYNVPVDQLDSRIQLRVKAELEKQQRLTWWKILSAKPLAEILNAVDVSAAFSIA